MSEIKMDSVELILQLLRTNMDQTFKTYYDGDPDLIPEFNLPACVVTKPSDTEVAATFSEDDVTETIVIKAILNKADDWAPEVEPTNMTEKKLRRIMEARDAETGRFLSNSIKGAIRLQLDGDRRIGEQMDLEIGVSGRPTGIQEGRVTGTVTTAEAHLTIQLMYSVDVDYLGTPAPED